MSLDTFNDRINRISNRTHHSPADMARGEGTAVLMYSSPLREAPRTTAKRSYKTLLMGLVLGAIVGILAGGLEDPSMPWGPGSGYTDLITLPVLVALVASPVMAIVGCAMQARYPSFFYFAAAYFPAAIGAALI